MGADRRNGGSVRGNRKPVLLRVARRLFFKNGYSGTTVEQVAKKAGFSKRTVYLYFKNKDELFLSVGEEGMTLLRRDLEAIDFERLSVEESMGAILDAYLRFAREQPHYFRIIFKEATPEMLGNVPAACRKRLAEHERACLGVVEMVTERACADGLVASSVDPVEVAATFFGAATGVLLLSMGGSQIVFSRTNREELVKKAVWTLYSGLRSTGKGGG